MNLANLLALPGAKTNNERQPQMPKPFAICRTEKLKHFGAITRSQKHNLRQQPTPNARPGMPGPSILFGADDVSAHLKNRLAGVKRRKDAVLAFEMVLTASPEFFSTATEATKKRWIEANTLFLQNAFGGNCQQAILHQDEATPHIHATFSCFTPDGRLAYADLLGTPAKLRKLQDDYATAMKPFGLRRGIAKSQRQHQTLAKRIDQLEESLQTVSNALKKLADHVHSLEGMKALSDALQALLPALNLPQQATPPLAPLASPQPETMGGRLKPDGPSPGGGLPRAGEGRRGTALRY